MNILFHGNVQTYTLGELKHEEKNAQNIRSLIDLLGNRYGEAFKAFLLAKDTCIILVNGKGIMTTGGLDTPLQSTDKVEVLPFVDAG